MAIVLQLPNSLESRVEILLRCRKVEYRKPVELSEAARAEALTIAERDGMVAANAFLNEEKKKIRGRKPSKASLVVELVELGLKALER